MREDSIWASYPASARTEYINSIKAMGALSPLFRQKSNDASNKTTYISSKFQENAFAQSFHGEVIDRGNEPYDIRIPSATPGKFDLVGIKTFLFASSSMQKVMQFKSIANAENWSLLIASGQLSEVMVRIAQVRNKRLRAFQEDLAGPEKEPTNLFENIIYHYLCPSSTGTVYVGETHYDAMRIEHLEIIPDNPHRNKGSFQFTDGIHTYRYTRADSTLYMHFDHASKTSPGSQIVDSFTVEQFADPRRVLISLIERDLTSSLDKLRNKEPFDSTVVGIHPASGDYLTDAPPNGRNPEAKPTVIFPLFRLTKRGGIPAGELDEKSGLNLRMASSKNKGSNTPRPVNEVEIKIPDARKFHSVFPEFFGKREDGVPLSSIGNIDPSTGTKTVTEDKGFDLTLLPSGTTMKAYLTGDHNKQINSLHKQTTLGKWLLSGVFQLNEREALTRAKLDELGLDGVRLTRAGNRHVTMEFIKVLDPDLEYLWPPKPDIFRSLATPVEDLSEE